MRVKNSFKKIISQIIHAGVKAPSNCEFRLFSKIKKSNFEGANIIDEKTIIINSNIGYATVIGPNGKVHNSEIGRYCSIGPNIKVIRGAHPSETFVSTCNLFYTINKPRGFTYVDTNKFPEFKYADEFKERSVVIGNDVWIGDSVSILEGVIIGDGAIIAAGAVVTSNVEPFSIVGGVPAKVIKYRFKPDEITFLNQLKWWDKGEEWIKKNSENFDDISKFIGSLKEV